ncbi:hypothetical protein DSECCO2_423890 [anaerobic digester metagenome]
MSWSVTPLSASITRMQISALSTAANALKTLYFSTVSLTLLFFLIPAVSIIVYFCSFLSNFVSMASLVVPGMSLTITLSSPMILLIMDDFPALGLPITAILMLSSSSAVSIVSSNFSIMMSRRSPMPNASEEDMLTGSPSPRL